MTTLIRWWKRHRALRALAADRAMRERFVGKPYAKRRAAQKRGLAS